MSVIESIRQMIAGETNRIFDAKTLAYLGNRAAIDQALSRLYRLGKLFRVGHGRYSTAPVQSESELQSVQFESEPRLTGAVFTPAQSRRLGKVSSQTGKRVLGLLMKSLFSLRQLVVGWSDAAAVALRGDLRGFTDKEIELMRPLLWASGSK
jgi:hypothetical protein